MSLLKPTLAESKIIVHTPRLEDLWYIMRNLKDNDAKKTKFDLAVRGMCEDELVEKWHNESVAKWMFLYENKILFACGLFKLKDNTGYALWWEPTKECEKLKKTYGYAALMAAEILKQHGGTIWTCTPLWYTQNIRATKHLGFKEVGEYLMFGEEFLLFKMEN